MREIKFRAWGDGKMFYPEDDTYWYLGDSGYWSFNSSGFDEPIIDNLDFEDAALMQYTGLKDGSGREIFEGDIIKGTEHDLDFARDVEYDEGGFSVSLNDHGVPGAYSPYLGELDLSRVEVVGNIHENPELLGGDKP